MNSIKLKQIIREEIQNVLKEAVRTTGKYYYIYFKGKNAVQGDPMSSKKAILKLGMEPADVKNVGPVYQLKLSGYTVYVITSLANKKDVWCVVTPGNAAFANDDEFSYELCMKAISSAMAGKGKQMTFDEYLKSGVSESATIVKEASSVPLKNLDFNKFEQILKLVTTPLTTAVLDTEEYEDYEGETISGFKKFKDIQYLAKFLMDFSKFYKTGNNADFRKALDLLSDNTDTLFAICDNDDSAEMLKNKKLAKSLTDVNEALSSFGYSVYEIEPDAVAKDYNKLADAVARLKM